MNMTPPESVVIASDIAVKSGEVYLGFADRFSGTLIITGELSAVTTAVEEIVDYFHNTLGYVSCPKMCIRDSCCSTGWLAVLFSRHASDPVLPDFWPPLLALCATSLSACFLTSAACGWPKLRRTMFALLAGGTLCLIALADCCAVTFSPRFFAYLAAALWQLHGAFCLLFSSTPQTTHRSI